MNWQLLGKSIAAATFVLGAAPAFGQTYPDVPPTTDGTAQSQESFNYGVCNDTNPACYHNWGVVRASPPRVLVYTRTAGPRHASLGSAMPVGVTVQSDTDCTFDANGGVVSCTGLVANNNTQKDMIRLLRKEGIIVDATETVTNLSNLNQYSAVVFFSNSRDTLWDHGRAVNPSLAVSTTTSAYLDQAKVALRQYMRAGGGFVAIHNGFGTEYNWPYYEGLLGNANYYDHGNFQNGTFQIVGNDASTAGVGPDGTRVAFMDEWYNLVPYPTNVKFLAAVDESTLATKRSVHPGFPSFHPVSWCHYYNGGRAWLTTLGHDVRDTHDLTDPLAQPGGSQFIPGAAQFQSLIVNGIKSAMGLIPFCT
jgi:type 1 glutamine amidotransferase